MSANTGYLTADSGTFHALLTYYAPTVAIPTTDNKLGALYCFLSRVEPWSDEQEPPAPQQTQKNIKEVFKNMFVAKQITTNDISPVIERIDWTSGETYSYYRDDVDMFQEEPNGTLARRFYVRNRFDQVFKCLWNNNGQPSTVEPYFEPGTFNANQIFQGADDYKWKYMYTITTGRKLKFMDDFWMPVPASNNVPNPIESNKGIGSIEVVNIINTGNNYNPAIATIDVRIVGDGQGASANAVVSAGQITDITVSNTGYGYSYANVIISSTTGSGAVAEAFASPIGGHGFNLNSELGVKHVMLTATFDKDEAGNLPTDIDFRQIGVLLNPLAYFGTSYGQANAAVYKLTTDLVVSQGFGEFVSDEIVFQSPDGLLENATFSATVLSFDSDSNVVKLINIQGTPIQNAVIVGNTSQTSRLVLQTQTPSFIKNSGYLIYLENREPTQRSPEGAEQFRLVLGH